MSLPAREGGLEDSDAGRSGEQGAESMEKGVGNAEEGEDESGLSEKNGETKWRRWWSGIR